MNLDNRVAYFNQGTKIPYAHLHSQSSQNILQIMNYFPHQPNAVLDISHLVRGWYLVMYHADTPEIRRPRITPYDLPIPPTLIKIPGRRRPQRRGPGRLPGIPPGSEDDKKDKDRKKPPVH